MHGDPDPRHYAGCDRVLLDIDPRGRPDVVAMRASSRRSRPRNSTRSLLARPRALPRARRRARRYGGFRACAADRRLRARSACRLESLMQARRRPDRRRRVVYTSRCRPDHARDMLYGWSVELERIGPRLLTRTRRGFTPKTLFRRLRAGGFAVAILGSVAATFELRAPSRSGFAQPDQLALLGCLAALGVNINRCSRCINPVQPSFPRRRMHATDTCGRAISVLTLR